MCDNFEAAVRICKDRHDFVLHCVKKIWKYAISFGNNDPLTASLFGRQVGKEAISQNYQPRRPICL